MARLSIKTIDVKRLFALSGNQCAFPGCLNKIVDDDGDVIAQICHIEAAEEGGERFNEDQTDDERRAFENLMLLCYPHHIKTNNVAKYTVSALKQMKAEHEAKFINAPYDFPLELEARIMDNIWELLGKVYEAVQGAKNLVEENLSVTIDANRGIQELLKLAQETRPSLPIDNGDIYAHQLAFIKKFRESMQPATGLAALEKFKEEHWNKISPELQYKVLANLGILLLDLDRKKDAGNMLVKILDLSYESSDSLAFVGLGYYLLGMKDDFGPVFRKAKEMGSQNINLWAAYIGIYTDDMPAGEMEKSVPRSILGTPQIQFALGQAFADQGDFERGVALMEKSASDDSAGEFADWRVEALVTLQKLVKIAEPMQISLKSFSQTELDDIRGMLITLTNIWDKIKNTEFRNAGWYLAVNRGVCYHILGEEDNATHDFEEAWRLQRSVTTFRNLLNQYMRKGDYVRARRLIDEKRTVSLENIEEKIDIEIYASRLISLESDPDLAVAGLEKLLLEANGHSRLRVLDIIVLLYFECGAFGKAQPFAERMILEFGNAPEGYISLGICQTHQSEREKGIVNLNHAAKILKSQQGSLASWVQLGFEFYDLKLFDRAAEAFEHIAKLDRFDEVNRKLLLAYFETGKFQKALALGEKMKSIVPSHPLVNEVLFRLHHQLGQKPQAEALLNSYLETADPRTFDHFRLLGIRFLLETGNRDKAVSFALQIERPGELAMEARYFLAKLLIRNGATLAGLDLAYEARLDNFELGRSHSLYFHSLIGGNQQSEEIMFPDSVALECGVEIVDGAGGKRKYMLTDDPRLRGNSVLRSSEPLTKELIGRRVGDKVALPNALGEGNVLTIIQILNKYTYAFQESLDLLEKKYAGESGLVSYRPSQDGDFTEFLKYITEGARLLEEDRREIMSLFNRETIPVGMLGKRLGRNIIEIWMEIITEQDTFLKSYVYDELGNLAKIISEKEIIVIEPISLLTNFGLIGSAQLLEKVEKKFVVARSTIVELREHRSNFVTMRPKATLGLEDGQLRKTVMSDKDADAHVAFIDSILDWCDRNAIVRDPTVRIEHHESILDIVGEGCFESLLLAHELDGGLFSDDQHLKALGQGLLDIPSFSTYQLATYCARTGRITNEEFREMSLTLIKANYAYIPITGDQLWQLFDDSSFQFRSPFIRAVRGLEIMAVPYCAEAIAEFARLLYLHIAFNSLREQAFSFVLRSAKRNPNFVKVTRALSVILARKFVLMPIQLNSVMALVHAVVGG